jgi:branched-chain amino acid transport system permease protein
MVEFLQFTLSGIVFGMIYAAIALSLVLIWRGTRLLNFAQGGMAMFTAYVAVEVIYKTGNYWAGFVVALAAGAMLGAAAEALVIRPTIGKPELNAVIITIGLLVALEGLAGMIYGGQYRSFPSAFSITGLKAGHTPLGISWSDVFVAGAGGAGPPGPSRWPSPTGASPCWPSAGGSPPAPCPAASGRSWSSRGR